MKRFLLLVTFEQNDDRFESIKRWIAKAARAPMVDSAPYYLEFEYKTKRSLSFALKRIHRLSIGVVTIPYECNEDNSITTLLHTDENNSKK